MTTKVCNRCEIEQPISEYWKKKESPDGYEYTCRTCRNKRRKSHNQSDEAKENKKQRDRERIKELWKDARYRMESMERLSLRYHSDEQKKIRLENKLLQNLYCVVYFRECIDCGAVTSGRSVFKSIKCRSCSRKGELKLRGVVCGDCGKEYIGKNEGARCKDCKKKALRKLRKKEKRLIGNHRKRAKHYGVYYEPVNKLKVFKRDKWKCKRCGVKVQNKVIHQPNTAHLDHIVPISKGGPHTYTNVQTLCRECNMRKGDSMPSQLRLCI